MGRLRCLHLHPPPLHLPVSPEDPPPPPPHTLLLSCREADSSMLRIAEMAGGWGNFIMQNEPSFLVLDSSLILVAVTLLCVFHPGFYFTRMCHVSKKGRKRGEKKGPGGDTGANELTEVAESGDSTNEVKAGTV